MTILTVHVTDVWMALPDMVVVKVRDQEVVKYAPVLLGAPDASAVGATVQRTNPATGASEYCVVVGIDKMYLKFGDKYPTVFADRTKLDDPTKWATIGGRTVTAVYRKSKPFDQCNGMTPGTLNSATFEHQCFLQLDGNLSQGGPYNIICTGAGFTATTFTFSENTTRCEFVHNTQLGHRPNDGYKRAAFSMWIPGYGTHGRIDLATELGSTAWEVIDASNSVVLSGNFTLKASPDASTPILASSKTQFISSADATTNILTVSPTAGAIQTGDMVIAHNHPAQSYVLPGGLTHGTKYYIRQLSTSTCTLHPTAADAFANTNIVDITSAGSGSLKGYLTEQFIYPSTTATPRVISAITLANPAVVTSTAHGLSMGDLLFCKRIAGMTQLEGKILKVKTVPSADTITCLVLGSSSGRFDSDLNTASGFSAFSGTGIYPAHNNELVPGYYDNQAATYVYEIDYTALTTPGTYRIRIPGLGVGDSFRINEGVYHTALKTQMKGIYNGLCGYALDPAIGGVSRPVMGRDGANQYNVVKESLCPGFFADEQGMYGVISGSAMVNTSTWLRAETTMGAAITATGFGGGWSDAGDVDWHVGIHCFADYRLLEYGYLRLPSASRDVKMGFPDLTDLFDPTTYAGTDALGDAVAIGLTHIEPLRASQKVDGRVYGGFAYGVDSSNTSTSIPPYLTHLPFAVHAADPYANFVYAGVAAKASQIFTAKGFTALAAMWKASAELAYDWADDLYADYLAHKDDGNNLANATLIQAYFIGKLNMKVNGGWSDATFNTHMTVMFGSWMSKPKQFAASVLMNINGPTSIYADYLATFATGAITEPTAIWEVANAAVPPGVSAQVANYHGISLTAGYANNRSVLDTVTDDFIPGNAHVTMANGKSLWVLGGNDYIFQELIKTVAPANMQTNTLHKMIQGGVSWNMGANQENMCATVGLGNRHPVVLHREREAMGLESIGWPGIVCFTWWESNNSGIAVQNFANNDSAVNYTQNAAITYPHKLIEPDYRSFPPFEAHWANTFVIYHTEFGGAQGLQNIQANLWLHAADGNTDTETPSTSTGKWLGLQF